jgi:hypothetical protein
MQKDLISLFEGNPDIETSKGKTLNFTRLELIAAQVKKFFFFFLFSDFLFLIFKINFFFRRLNYFNPIKMFPIDSWARTK